MKEKHKYENLIIYMNGLDEYIIPYLISQVVSIIILIAAWKRTRWARWLFSALFLWASATNMFIGLTDPDSYLNNAQFAIPLYQDFYQWMVQSLQSHHYSADRSWTIFYFYRHGAKWLVGKTCLYWQYYLSA